MTECPFGGIQQICICAALIILVCIYYSIISRLF